METIIGRGIDSLMEWLMQSPDEDVSILVDETLLPDEWTVCGDVLSVGGRIEKAIKDGYGVHIARN